MPRRKPGQPPRKMGRPKLDPNREKPKPVFKNPEGQDLDVFGRVTERRPIGRPRAEYDPAMCDELIVHMAQGYSFESFAGTLVVSLDTIQRWADQKPDFCRAKKVGFELCRLFWENAGIDGLKQKFFQYGVWAFNMKNRFKEQWRDKHEITVTPNVQAMLEGKSKDEILRLGQDAMKRLGGTTEPAIDVVATPVKADKVDDVFDL